MNFTDTIFPIKFYWLAFPFYFGLLGWAIYTAPWQRFVQSSNLHVFLGATIALMLAWRVQAGIHPGLNFHLLGATFFLLMFGWQFAMISLSVVLLVVEALNGNWLSLPLNGVVMIAIPLMFSYWVWCYSVRYLPHHFFVYTLFNGFFCAAMAVTLMILTASGLMLCCGPYNLLWLKTKYLAFAPLMVFAEGFLTGMLITSMVLFRPEWITTYNDKRYIIGK